MITRIKLLWKSYLVCSDINERYDIRQASFTSVFEFFCITGNLGVSGLSYRIFFIFGSSQLSEPSTDLQDSGLQSYFIILGTGLSSHEPVYVVVIFQYLIKRRTFFLRKPVVRVPKNGYHHH